MHQNPSHDDLNLRLLVRKRAITQRAWEALFKRFKVLEAQGFSQADFARAVGKAPARISRILSRPSNMTLESYAELAHGLGTYPVLELREPSIGNIRPATAPQVEVLSKSGVRLNPGASTPPVRVVDVPAPNRTFVDA